MSDQLRNIAEAAIRSGEPRVQVVSPQLILATLYAQDQRIAEQEAVIIGLSKNAAFYRCCAMSGEIPTVGSEPYQESTHE